MKRKKIAGIFALLAAIITAGRGTGVQMHVFASAQDSEAAGENQTSSEQPALIWLEEAGETEDETEEFQEENKTDTGAEGADGGGYPILRLSGDIGIGKRVTILSASTNSVNEGDEKDNSPYYAVDGDSSTVWQEWMEGNGIGSWLRFEFDEEYEIAYLTFQIGNWTEKDGKDYDYYYYANSRPKKLKVTFGAVEWEITFSKDEKEEYLLLLPPGIRANFAEIKLIDAYTGNRWKDTAISDIGIYYIDRTNAG